MGVLSVVLGAQELGLLNTVGRGVGPRIKALLLKDAAQHGVWRGDRPRAEGKTAKVSLRVTDEEQAMLVRRRGDAQLAEYVRGVIRSSVAERHTLRPAGPSPTRTAPAKAAAASPLRPREAVPAPRLSEPVPAPGSASGAGLGSVVAHQLFAGLLPVTGLSSGRLRISGHAPGTHADARALVHAISLALCPHRLVGTQDEIPDLRGFHPGDDLVLVLGAGHTAMGVAPSPRPAPELLEDLIDVLGMAAERRPYRYTLTLQVMPWRCHLVVVAISVRGDPAARVATSPLTSS